MRNFILLFHLIALVVLVSGDEQTCSLKKLCDGHEVSNDDDPKPCRKVTFEKIGTEFETHIINWKTLIPGDKVYCEVDNIVNVESICGVTTTKTGKDKVLVTTLSDFTYRHVTQFPPSKMLRFKLQGGAWSYIGLFPGPTTTSADKSEVILDCGLRQCIYNKNYEYYYKAAQNYLNKDEERGFWIRYTKTNLDLHFIEVGKDPETEPFMSGEIHFEPKYFGLKSPHNAGAWTFTDAENLITTVDKTVNQTASVTCWTKQPGNDPCERKSIKALHARLINLVREYENLRVNNKTSSFELIEIANDVAQEYKEAKEQYKEVHNELLEDGYVCPIVDTILTNLEKIKEIIDKKIDKRCIGKDCEAVRPCKDCVQGSPEVTDELNILPPVKEVTTPNPYVDSCELDGTDCEDPVGLKVKETPVTWSRDVRPVSYPCISGLISAKEDFYVALLPEEENSVREGVIKDVYKIVFGAKGNKQLQIVKNNEILKSVDVDDILHGSEHPAGFWIQFHNGKIEVGHIDVLDPLISFEAGDDMYKVKGCVIGSKDSNVKFVKQRRPRCPNCENAHAHQKFCLKIKEPQIYFSPGFEVPPSSGEEVDDSDDIDELLLTNAIIAEFNELYNLK